MADVFASTFLQKLSALESSQKSISEASAFMLQHAQFCKLQSEIILKTFKGTSLEKQINLIYLVNDVVQTSKRSHGELFTAGLHTFLGRAFCILAKTKDNGSLQKLQRLCQIWTERNIFRYDQIHSFQQILSGNIPDLLEDQPMPPLIELDSRASWTDSKNPVVKLMGSVKAKKRELTSGMEGDRAKLLQDNIYALMEQIDSEQAAAVLGHDETVVEQQNDSFNSTGDQVQLVTEEIVINYKKSYDLLNRYTTSLEKQRNENKRLLTLLQKRLKREESMLAAGGARQQFEEISSSSRRAELLEKASIAWDTISRYEQMAMLPPPPHGRPPPPAAVPGMGHPYPVGNPRGPPPPPPPYGRPPPGGAYPPQHHNTLGVQQTYSQQYLPQPPRAPVAAPAPHVYRPAGQPSAPERAAGPGPFVPKRGARPLPAWMSQQQQQQQ